jgi:hypothetical protein
MTYLVGIIKKRLGMVANALLALLHNSGFQRTQSHVSVDEVAKPSQYLRMVYAEHLKRNPFLTPNLFASDIS